MIKVFSKSYEWHFNEIDSVKNVSNYLCSSTTITDQYQIANDLDISIKTVKRAIRTLKDLGKLIVLKDKKSYVYIIGEDASNLYKVYKLMQD